MLGSFSLLPAWAVQFARGLYERTSAHAGVPVVVL